MDTAGIESKNSKLLAKHWLVLCFHLKNWVQIWLDVEVEVVTLLCCSNFVTCIYKIWLVLDDPMSEIGAVVMALDCFNNNFFQLQKLWEETGSFSNDSDKAKIEQMQLQSEVGFMEMRLDTASRRWGIWRTCTSIYPEHLSISTHTLHTAL